MFSIVTILHVSGKSPRSVKLKNGVTIVESKISDCVLKHNSFALSSKTLSKLLLHFCLILIKIMLDMR